MGKIKQTNKQTKKTTWNDEDKAFIFVFFKKLWDNTDVLKCNKMSVRNWFKKKKKPGRKVYYIFQTVYLNNQKRQQ